MMIIRVSSPMIIIHWLVFRWQLYGLVLRCLIITTLGKLPKLRRYGAHMGFFRRIDTILNWTELIIVHRLLLPLSESYTEQFWLGSMTAFLRNKRSAEVLTVSFLRELPVTHHLVTTLTHDRKVSVSDDLACRPCTWSASFVAGGAVWLSACRLSPAFPRGPRTVGSAVGPR